MIAPLPNTITKTEEPRYDSYTGPLEDLIAAGLVRRDQLPAPGKRSISWRLGIYQPRRCQQDEHYMRVVVYDDGTAEVQTGLTEDARAPRLEAERITEKKRREEWERRQRELDPGQGAAMELLHAASSSLPLGSRVRCAGSGMEAIVEGEYGTYTVRKEDGEYIDRTHGHRISHQYGYRCRLKDGRMIFAPAHELRRIDGRITHLRLV